MTPVEINLLVNVYLILLLLLHAFGKNYLKFLGMLSNRCAPLIRDHYLVSQYKMLFYK